MSLPKVQYPTYLTQIPSTGKDVKYRPFTVREEQILLTAMQGGDENEIVIAVKEIIKACYFNNIDPEKLATYDVEFLFLQLRIKSISNIVEMEFRNNACEKENGNPCKKSVIMKIDLEKASVQSLNKETKTFELFANKTKNEKGFVVKLSENLGVRIKHPGITELSLDEVSKTTSLTKLMNLIKSCITSVFDDETVYDEFTKEEMSEWVDSLTIQQKELLVEFMTAIPKVRLETKFRCNACGYEEPIVFEGLQSFFG